MLLPQYYQLQCVCRLYAKLQVSDRNCAHRLLAILDKSNHSIRRRHSISLHLNLRYEYSRAYLQMLLFFLNFGPESLIDIYFRFYKDKNLCSILAG